MKILKKDKFTIDIPVCYFMPADFKSRSSFYKRLDNKYDLRRTFKIRYPFYSDIYQYNKREGDCLKLNIKSLKGFGLVVFPTVNDPITEKSLDNAIRRLKDYICKENIKEIQISPDGICHMIDYEDLEDVLKKWFGLVDVTIYILED